MCGDRAIVKFGVAFESFTEMNPVFEAAHHDLSQRKTRRGTPDTYISGVHAERFFKLLGHVIQVPRRTRACGVEEIDDVFRQAFLQRPHADAVDPNTISGRPIDSRAIALKYIDFDSLAMKAMCEAKAPGSCAYDRNT
ncbi:hypothetical protein PBS_52830 [Paraburkholderia sp. 2C]